MTSVCVCGAGEGFREIRGWVCLERMETEAAAKQGKACRENPGISISQLFQAFPLPDMEGGILEKKILNLKASFNVPFRGRRSLRYTEIENAVHGLNSCGAKRDKVVGE